ncbi:sulfite exporter TauE/SafE family protein [Desmospora activa]|uniref:sulfite exporter TauE/SafE family protein n=1 Tax=Desmospora activa TaxID=500615 RepID=UPI000D312D32|nr:sulfite exporter TauE/SafE family protein [Desmospora activa]
MEWILLILIGLLAGTIGSLVGLGGGVIIVPALLFFAALFPEYSHITPQVAVGTSLILVIITALSSTISYTRQKRVDFPSAWAFFLASGPGAIVGAYLTNFFAPGSFFIAFGVIMIVNALITQFRDRLKSNTVKWDVKREFTDHEGNIYRYGYHRPTVWIGGFLIGILSSLFGIGGGSFMVPMMVVLFQFPPHVAIATSMFIMFLSSIVGSITHFIQGNIDWIAVLLIAPGAWFGGQLGAWISARISGKWLMIGFRIVILLVAVRMIIQGLA